MATSTHVSSTKPINKKKVSFCDASSNAIYIVENYKLECSSIGERARVWYGKTELDKFVKDEFVSRFDATEEEAGIAFEMTYNRQKRKRAKAPVSPLPLLIKEQLQNQLVLNQKLQFLLNQKLHVIQHSIYNRGTKQHKTIATDNSTLRTPTRDSNLWFHSNAFEMSRNRQKRKRAKEFVSQLPLLTKEQLQNQFLLNQKLHATQLFCYNRDTKRHKTIATDDSKLSTPTRDRNLQFHSNAQKDHLRNYTNATRYYQTPTLGKKSIAAATHTKDGDPRFPPINPPKQYDWLWYLVSRRHNNHLEPSTR